MTYSANPMLNLLNQSEGLQQRLKSLNQIKDMMNRIRYADNPQALLLQMIQQNPQLQQVMNYINQNGGDPKQAFYKMAEEKGTNPDDILKLLK